MSILLSETPPLQRKPYSASFEEIIQAIEKSRAEFYRMIDAYIENNKNLLPEFLEQSLHRIATEGDATPCVLKSRLYEVVNAKMNIELDA